MNISIYKVELYDSKNNEFFFVEVGATSSHEAICLAESNWENSYGVEAKLV